MQCSAGAADLVRQHVGAAAVEQDRWNSCGPSPARTPVHSDVYGFIRSAVEERGSSCRKTSRSCHAGSTFSIPISVTSTFGSVRHMRPLPSDSTTPIVPVSAIPKFAPETATGTVRNFARRCSRAASAIADASLPSDWPLRDRALEQRADLGPVAVDRGHEDVRLLVARGELDDQLREVGLQRVDALGLQRLVDARSRPSPAT